MRRRSSFVAIVVVLMSAFNSGIGSAAERREQRDEQRGRTVRQVFEVTIHRGPSAGLVVIGVLTLDVEPGTGVLTGVITPGFDPRTGRQKESVLFTFNGSSLVPHPDVTEIQVRGQVQHHAANLVLLDVGGAGKNIYGVGTSVNDSGRGLQRDPGTMGGPAVGPEPGDSGDWLRADGFTVCASIGFFSVCVNFSF